jgi:hypothetical protein
MKKDIWSDPRTKIAIALAYEDFPHDVICNYSRLGRGAVAYRLGKHGVSTVESRRAENEQGKERLQRIMRQQRQDLRLAAKEKKR